MDCQHIVFYGTLQTECDKFRELELDRHLVFVSDCFFRGDLFDIEDTRSGHNYPAMIDGKGMVKGQLFHIREPSFLHAADLYEGIRPGDTPAQSDYRREILRLAKPEIDAWVYIYNQSVADCLKIDGGDWLAHIEEKSGLQGAGRKQG
ncbi:MAG: gamma-glutamylcyclotransferase [Alphaproteobacteria bacterium]|nr:MAG: gamma-glutamylcyclotransferase [Alphaproteobacteria bacterium]